MKILILNWQDIKNPLGGGAEVHLHEIFKRIAAQGHSVTLYCSRFPGSAEREEIDGIRVIREGGRYLFNYYVPGRYWTQFRKEGFDVVVDDINKIPFFTPRFVKEPLVGIVHHLFGRAIFLEASLIPAIYVALGEKIAVRVYRRTPMAVVSESTRQELVGFGFPEANIAIVPNAVNSALYGLPEGESTPGPVIGHLGRLKRYKSVEHLLQAFQIVRQEMPEARLKIIGDGDHRPALEKTAAGLGLTGSVEFTGYLSQTEKVQQLHQLKVAVSCSAKEGWGLTVIEANSCGVPVIASDVPGLRDSVIDERTGLLFEYGNVEQLAQKILLLLRDENLRSRLRLEAIVWGRTFNWDESARKMIDLLARVVARKKGNASL
jgi:glycosyltransferase involved in cell wall biosynthesis